MSTASWIVVNASSRWPRSDSLFERLFNDPARLGRSASGRATLRSVQESQRQLGRVL